MSIVVPKRVTVPLTCKISRLSASSWFEFKSVIFLTPSHVIVTTGLLSLNRPAHTKFVHLQVEMVLLQGVKSFKLSLFVGLDISRKYLQSY